MELIDSQLGLVSYILYRSTFFSWCTVLSYTLLHAVIAETICLGKLLNYCLSILICMACFNTGQEKYRILGFGTGLTQRFYANASAVVIVYDITDEETYKEATGIWFKEAMHNLDHYGATNIPIILVGNKSDLQSRAIDIDEARDFSRQFHLLPPIECSAKEDENVTRLFQSVAQEIVKNGTNFMFCDSIILRDDVSYKKGKGRTDCCQ